MTHFGHLGFLFKLSLSYGICPYSPIYASCVCSMCIRICPSSPLPLPSHSAVVSCPSTMSQGSGFFSLDGHDGPAQGSSFSAWMSRRRKQTPQPKHSSTYIRICRPLNVRLSLRCRVRNEARRFGVPRWRSGVGVSSRVAAFR